VETGLELGREVLAIESLCRARGRIPISHHRPTTKLAFPQLAADREGKNAL
jgi:hypothetical protein